MRKTCIDVHYHTQELADLTEKMALSAGTAGFGGKNRQREHRSVV